MSVRYVRDREFTVDCPRGCGNDCLAVKYEDGPSLYVIGACACDSREWSDEERESIIENREAQNERDYDRRMAHLCEDQA